MKQILSLLLLSGLILCSCNKTITPTISLAPNYASFASDGGVATTTVTCNCSWVADCEVEGVVITPSSFNGDSPVSLFFPATKSKVTLSVPVTFTATSGESTSTTTFVATLQAKPYVEVLQAKETISVPATANGKIINIESNSSWEYVPEVGNENLTVNPTSGKYSQEVLVSFPESTSSEDKNYSLTFRLKDDVSTKTTVNFIQKGKK